MLGTGVDLSATVGTNVRFVVTEIGSEVTSGIWRLVIHGDAGCSGEVNGRTNGLIGIVSVYLRDLVLRNRVSQAFTAEYQSIPSW